MHTAVDAHVINRSITNYSLHGGMPLDVLAIITVSPAVKPGYNQTYLEMRFKELWVATPQ